MFHRKKKEKKVIEVEAIREVSDVDEPTSPVAPVVEEPIKWIKSPMTKKDAAWYTFSAFVLVAVVIQLLLLAYWLLKLLWVSKWFLIAWSYTLTKIAFFVLAPIAVILGNLWLLRKPLLKKGSSFAAKKYEIDVATPTVEGEADKAAKSAGLTIGGVRIHDAIGGKDKHSLMMIDTVKCGVAWEDSQIVVKASIDGLVINMVTYDMRFKDTNIQRLLDKISPPDETDLTEEELHAQKEEECQKKKDEKKKTDKKKKKKSKPLLRIAPILLTNATISVKSKGKLGTRDMILPIKLHEEHINPETFSSLPCTLMWLNGVVARAIANSGLDALNGVFDGVGGMVPGGSILAGGAKNLVGGVAGGVGGVLGGIGGGGAAIGEGLKSGTVSGVAGGFAKGGMSVVGGVGKGVGAVGGGVFKATGASHAMDACTHRASEGDLGEKKKKSSWFKATPKKDHQ